MRTAHTSQLDVATLEATRDLLYMVFDDMTDHDWEHALGGVHALVYDETELVGHASLIQRRLLHRGRALRAGYVEGVAVRKDQRGLGHGAAMMQALEAVARRAYDVAALGATDEAAQFYAGRGWLRWLGPTSALTPRGIQHTPGDDGAVYVLSISTPLDVHDELTCDWRDGDVW
jgi:aminoglycoside 2'-N-acetyltransferase I